MTDGQNQNPEQPETILPVESLTTETQVEEFAGLSNGDAPVALPETTAVQPEGSPLTDEGFKRTKLHEILNECWGLGAGKMDHYRFSEIIQYADPEMAKKEKDGFSIGDIHWTPAAGGNGPEFIYKKGKNLTDEDAHTLVALAKMRGWQNLQLHGNEEQKNQLWLAVARRNLRDFKQFDQGKLIGPDGKPVTDFQWTGTSGYEPLPDAAIFKTPAYAEYLKEYEEYQKLVAAYTPGAQQDESVAPTENIAAEPIETAPPVEPIIADVVQEQPAPVEVAPVEVAPVEVAPVEPAAAEQPAPEAAAPPPAVEEPPAAQPPVSASIFVNMPVNPPRDAKTDIQFRENNAPVPETPAAPPPDAAHPVIPRRPDGP